MGRTTSGQECGPRMGGGYPRNSFMGQATGWAVGLQGQPGAAGEYGEGKVRPGVKKPAGPLQDLPGCGRGWGERWLLGGGNTDKGTHWTLPSASAPLLLLAPPFPEARLAGPKGGSRWVCPRLVPLSHHSCLGLLLESVPRSQAWVPERRVGHLAGGVSMGTGKEQAEVREGEERVGRPPRPAPLCRIGAVGSLTVLGRGQGTGALGLLLIWAAYSGAGPPGPAAQAAAGPGAVPLSSWWPMPGQQRRAPVQRAGLGLSTSEALGRGG